MTNDNHTPGRSDDELGAALGRSVRHRVDEVPTLTPGFEGVQRRARQITNRRRAIAGAAIGAFVLVGGIGLATLGGEDGDRIDDTFVRPTYPEVEDPGPDDEDPPTVGEFDPAIDLETLVVRGNGFPVIGDSTSTTGYPFGLDGRFDEADIGRALVAADGSLLIELHGRPAVGEWRPTATEVLRYNRLTDAWDVLSADGVLAGVALVDNVAVAFVGDLPSAPTPGSDTGDLRIVELRDDADFRGEIWLADAYGIEWGVTDVVHRAGRFLVDHGGLDTTWTIRDRSGAELPLATPTDGTLGDNYGRAGDTGPRPTAATLSQDGTTIWWVEEDPWTYVDGVAVPTESVKLRSLDVDRGELGDEIIVRNIESDVRLQIGISGAADQILVNASEPTDSTTGRQYRWPVGVDVTDAPTLFDPMLSSGRWEFVRETTLERITDSTPTVGTIPRAPNGLASSVLTQTAQGWVRLGPDGAQQLVLADPTITAVKPVGDGSLVVHRSGDESQYGEVVHLIEGTLEGETRLLGELSNLSGAALVNGVPVAFLSERPATDDGTAPLRRVDLRTGESTDLIPDVNGIEWVVGDVEVRGDIALVQISDLATGWIFHDVDTGERIDASSDLLAERIETDWTVFDSEAFTCCVAWSDDGTTVHWFEHVLEGGQNPTDRPGTLRSIDLATGIEGDPITVELPGSESPVDFALDTRGDQVLLSVTGLTSTLAGTPAAVAIVIDTTAGTTDRLPLLGGPWAYID